MTIDDYYAYCAAKHREKRVLLEAARQYRRGTIVRRQLARDVKRIRSQMDTLCPVNCLPCIADR